MPFARPTPEQLRQRLIAEIGAHLPGADPRLRRSVETVLASIVTMSAQDLYGYLSWLSRQLHVTSAEAEWLASHARMWGITRAAAVAASGEVTLSGLAGAVVPAGTELRRGDDARYLLEEDVTLDAEGGSGQVVAVAAGAAGNAAAGSTLSLLAPIAGVSGAVVGEAGLTGGLDEESDAGIRARTLARIQRPPHGGASYDYPQWVREIAGGDTRVFVRPRHMGPGTVGVLFVLADGSMPAGTLVEAVQAHVEQQRPVTAEVLVTAPVPLPVDLTVRLQPDTVATRAAATAELAAMLLREAEPGLAVPLSRLGAAISSAAGVYSHQITAPAEDIAVGAGQIARLGTITWLPA